MGTKAEIMMISAIAILVSVIIMLIWAIDGKIIGTTLVVGLVLFFRHIGLKKKGRSNE